MHMIMLIHIELDCVLYNKLVDAAILSHLQQDVAVRPLDDRAWSYVDF